jgi:hypothetical protein
MVLEQNGSQRQQKAFGLDIFSSRNIIVAQIDESSIERGSDLFFQINRSVW